MLNALRSLHRRWEDGVVARHGPTAADWHGFVANIALLDGLEPVELDRLRRLVGLFLHRKRIEGAADLPITDDMRLAIAAQACVPILDLGLHWYRGWSTVIVYPDEFLARHDYTDEDGVVHDVRRPLVGEAHHTGPVILSWAHIVEDLEGLYAANVTVHELAHKLDMLSGDANGMPPLHREMSRRTWTEAFTRAFEDLNARVDAGEETLIDPYAAEEPGEFFAVLSETFFVDPKSLLDLYPQVYAQLRLFYRQDPITRWRPA